MHVLHVCATTNEVRTCRISPISFNLYSKGKPSNKQTLGSNQRTKLTTENLPFWQAPVRKSNSIRHHVEVEKSPRRFEIRSMHFARWTHVTKSRPVPGFFHYARSPLTAHCRLGWSSYSKMAASSPSIPQLFTELDRFGKDGNFEKAQKIANKSNGNFSSPP